MSSAMIARLAALLVAAGCFACAVVAQQPKDIPARVKLTINGLPVSGEREVLEATEAQGPNQAEQIFSAAIIPVARNEAFQLVVEAIHTDGSREALTKSGRLRYEHDGLTVSAEGFVTVTPTSTCTGPADLPRLTVVLLGTDGHVQGWNRYLFEVR